MRQRRNVRATTPDALREQALQKRVTGDAKARQLLEAADNEANKIEARADELELAERVAQRREELTAAAVRVAQVGLKARQEADEADAKAAQLKVEAAEGHAVIAAAETELRHRCSGVEQLTANGEIDRAIALEQGLGHLDSEPARAKLAQIETDEKEARDRAAEARARAEQCASEAADLRAAIATVEDELRPEFDQRREAREVRAAQKLVAFDYRLLNSAGALMFALSKGGAEKPQTGAGTGTTALDNYIDVDKNGRFLGVGGLVK